jgi:hypothetical protein
MYKISLLRDEVKLINEDGLILTVSQINKVKENGKVETETEVVYLNEVDDKEWFIAKKETWSFDAEIMINRMIEDSLNTQLSPGWYQRAIEAARNIDTASIEKIIMDALSKAEGVTEFYIKGEQVDIHS